MTPPGGVAPGSSCSGGIVVSGTVDIGGVPALGFGTHSPPTPLNVSRHCSFVSYAQLRLPSLSGIVHQGRLKFWL